LATAVEGRIFLGERRPAMHIIRTAIRRLIDWLAEQEPSSDQTLSPRDWADLPPHHPCTN
jgi:hypothetical protein